MALNGGTINSWTIGGWDEEADEGGVAAPPMSLTGPVKNLTPSISVANATPTISVVQLTPAITVTNLSPAITVVVLSN